MMKSAEKWRRQNATNGMYCSRRRRVRGRYSHFPPFATASAFPNCHGTFDAVSFVVDWQFGKKFDAYAGIMFSQVNGGLASDFLNRSTIDPTVGLRFRF
jgi:hypothetical protein